MSETLEVILRTTAAFFGILLVTRLLNKEQVGQLTFYEYVTGITIGSLAATMSIDTEAKLFPDMVGLFVWALLTFVMGSIALVSRPARKLLEGEPTVLVHNGKVLEKNMAKLRYNLDDLLIQLRNKNAFYIADVEYAILEPNGQLSVLFKSQKRPLTPQDLQLSTQYEGIATELILDGEIIVQNLNQLHLDHGWLMAQLAKHGVKDVGEVVLASLDSQGNLFVDLRKDRMGQVADITDDTSDKPN